MEEVSNNNIISFKSRKKVSLRWHKSDLFLQFFAPLAPGRHWRARRAAAVTKNEMHTIINLDRSIILISFIYEYYKIIYEWGYKYYLQCKFKPGAYPRDFDWGGRDGELPPQSGALGGQRLFSSDLPMNFRIFF